MIRILSPLLGLALLVTPVLAEDFSGFYAGANAGYGWGREESRGTATPSPRMTTPDRADGTSALPPSATAATAGLVRSGSGAGRTAGSR